MLFTCTPGQLAAHIFASLAVADSLSLEQLWAIVLEKTTDNSVDNMQKNVAWRSIMGVPGNLISVKVSGAEMAELPSLQYGELLVRGSELEITLHPTDECQARYLTGTENFQAIRASLGEMPFQLLVVIGRHGKQGILNPDLARESGQDARSLWLRLQKLEAAGLIVCTSVYENKIHTSRSIHVKFVGDRMAVQESSEADQDLKTTRDVGKLKKYIVEAVKAAPNQLRGFSDLCKELKLDDAGAASKFFRSVCVKLHNDGFVEKLRVEMPETKQRVYALKFVKDLPKDAESLEFGHEQDFEENDAVVDDDEDGESEPKKFPLLNHTFPLFHQIFHQIYSRGPAGVTSGEVANSLMGISEYKPYTRIYESMPSYISNSKNLKPSKKQGDPYDECTVSKLYDNEGKLKFYRYFATNFCKEEKPQPKPYSPKEAATKESLVQLNKKLHSTLGKTSNEVLLEKKRRMVEISAVPTKKQRVEKAQSEDLVELALEELPKRRRTKAHPSYADDFMDLDGAARNSDDDFDPTAQESDPKDMELRDDMELKDSSLKNAMDLDLVKSEEPETQLLSSNHLPTFAPRTREPKKDRSQPNPYKSEDSHRSMTRRALLVEMIKEDGGATFSTPGLCRKLDERLGNTTTTDMKTLNRDVAYLTEHNVLELQNVPVELVNRTVERKLLVLADAESRPPQAKIDELVGIFAEKNRKRELNIQQRRMIQSDIKLYIEKPREKEERRPRSKNRLLALGDTPVKRERTSVAEADIMSKIKKSKRARKATIKSEDGSQLERGTLAKKGRRNIRLDRADSTLVYRAVVISKAFTRHAIDFDAIAALLGELDGKMLRQKWGTLRRSYGGAAAVNKGVETFQNMVMQGVEDGTISEKDLVDMDMVFFLNYWKSFDSSTEFYVLDDMPLYATSKQNEATYDIVRSPAEAPTGYWERIEDISMRQKESVLCQSMFSYEELAEPAPKPLDEVRSVLKAMFLATNEDTGLSKPILEQYGEAMVREACNALLRDKEISYVSLDSDTKFLVGDRFHSSLVLKIFTPKFFHQAAAFKDSLSSISKSGKGLVVSQGIMPGQMASLLEMISHDMVELIRIDRAFRFENYESRLIDKELIACDIIVKCDFEKADHIKVSSAPVPYRSPCQPIWIQLNSLVNKQLWTKVVLSLVYHVVFRPGIADLQLYTKLQAVLSLKDYYAAMEWLISTGCVSKVDSGYFATDRWQYILGY